MLRDLGLEFRIQAPHIDESRLKGEPADAYARRLAREKAQAAASALGDSRPDWAVLAADTIVVHGKAVLGKPADADDAARMLRKLSGRSHDVVTAFCWLGARDGKPRQICSHARTKVTFAERPPEFWRWYVSTGEPMDKAGAYAAQGIGMSFIEKVTGSYSNVVGLPLSLVLDAFRKAFGEDLRELCRTAR
jgi:septum formation protein